MLFLSGCSDAKRPADLPQLHLTSITFTQEDQPLSGAEIIFFSKDNSCRWAVAGTTDSNGTAVLHTHGRFIGAPEGTFVITVSKTETENSEQGEVQTKPILVYTLVNKKYCSQATSPLEIKIEKGKNAKTFDLGKAEKTLLEKIDPPTDTQGT